MTRDELTALLDRHRVELHALPGVLSVGVTERAGEPVVELLVARDADVTSIRPAVESLLAGAPLVVSRSGPVVSGT